MLLYILLVWTLGRTPRNTGKSIVWKLEDIAKFKVFSINPTYVVLYMARVDLGEDTTGYWIIQLCGN